MPFLTDSFFGWEGSPTKIDKPENKKELVPTYSILSTEGPSQGSSPAESHGSFFGPAAWDRLFGKALSRKKRKKQGRQSTQP